MAGVQPAGSTTQQPWLNPFTSCIGANPQASAQAPVVPTGSYRPEPSYHPQLFGLTPQQGGPSANAASFADEVRGRNSQAIDLELMQIANAVYDPNTQSVGDWTRVSDSQLSAAGIDPATLETPDTGFRAGIFTDGDGNYVLAFSGSNERIDWTGANFPQGLGMQTEQYDQAVALAQKVAASEFGRDGNVVITGHSLGGGLSGIASLATDIPAVTFDASGVHDDTMRQFGLNPGQAKQDAENGLIRRYNVAGDPLTAAQEDTPGLNRIMPDAPGHEITLDSPLPPIEAPEWTWNPIEMAKRTADYLHDKAERVGDLHRQQTMIDALAQQRPWEN